MLENIRENSSGVVAWGVAILIIVTMAFFGVSSYVGHQPYAVIAEVGGRSITEDNFRYTFQNWQRSALQRMGDNAPVDLDSDVFKLQTLDRMINQELVAEISEKENYRVGDQQIANLIRNNPEFQTDGKFDPSKYTTVAGGYGSKTAYEENLRQNLSSQQVLLGLADSGFVLPNKLNDLVELRTEKREFDLVRFPISEYAKKIDVSDEEISKDYAANIDAYNQEERVAVEFVRFKATDLESEIDVSEEDLRLAYEQDEESNLSQATREVRHILLAGDDAENQANAAIERLNQGESFADVAKELSQDPGSAENGGSLGVIEREQMVKEFEDAAYALDINTVSEPVRSQFGYHVIEVTKINAPTQKTFEEMRDGLETAERKRQAEELFFEQIEQLKNIVYENSDSLQVAADELSLKVEKTALFSRTSGNGLAASQEVRDVAFSEDVLFNDLNSDVIELSPTEYVAIRKDQHLESKPKPLEEVKQQIKDKLGAEKAVSVVSAASEEALKLAKETQSWSDMLEKLSLTAESQSFSYANGARPLPRELLNKVFSAGVSSFDNKIGTAVDASGNAFVFQLKEVATESGDNTDAVKDSSERLFQAREGGATLVQRFLQGKRDDFNVEINEDLL